jgi:hypothetical protein
MNTGIPSSLMAHGLTSMAGRAMGRSAEEVHTRGSRYFIRTLGKFPRHLGTESTSNQHYLSVANGWPHLFVDFKCRVEGICCGDSATGGFTVPHQMEQLNTQLRWVRV